MKQDLIARTWLTLLHEVDHSGIGDPWALVPLQEGSPAVREDHPLKPLDGAQKLPFPVSNEAVDDVVVAGKVFAEVLVAVGNVPDDDAT